MKKLFLGLFLFLLLGGKSFAAYSLSEADFVILDRVEQKVFDMVENKTLDPESFVLKAQTLVENKDYSDRIEALLALLIEDLSYSYGISEDSQDFAMSEEDCYEDEVYDTDAGVCIPDYYENGGWDDYYDDEAYYDDEFDDSEYYDDEEDAYYYDDEESDDTYPDWYGGNEDFGDEYLDEDYNNDYSDESSDPEQQVANDASYKVQGDTITLLSGKKDASHEKIWSMFVSLVPAANRSELTSFNVYTDKNDGNIAGVFLNPEANNTWDLTVNKAMFYDSKGNFDLKENIHTLIHESAHLLTLGQEQVDYIPTNVQSDAAINRLASKCSTTFVSEGCLKTKAYMENFIKTFWTKKEMETIEDGGNVYSPSKFVSDYAASDTAEDMAETFTYFVLEGKPDGDTIAEKKMLFFYNYEELVALRELMRKRIAELN